jgi:IS605 OrfB family transposase
LPDALGGGNAAIPVKFRYREADFLAALTPKPQKLTRGPRANQTEFNTVVRPDAISYRFVREDGQWFVHASFETVAAPITTRRDAGCVGVDLNPWGLAVSRIDRSGNVVEHFDLPWSVQDRSTNQVKAAVGDAVRDVVLYANEHGVPLAGERLDFAEWKKSQGNARFNRMLSAFAYAAFAQMVRGRCAREGVELISVNPAFTSVIGRGKFAMGYGLSVHRAAAMAIARRALNFGEKLRTRSAGSALALPARNRTRHVWHNWGRWAKAQRPRRKSSLKPQGNHGSKPSCDRAVTPDPSPPNGRTLHGCAGGQMPRPNAALTLSGAIPEANGRSRCSRGLAGALSPQALLGPARIKAYGFSNGLSATEPVELTGAIGSSRRARLRRQAFCDCGR